LTWLPSLAIVAAMPDEPSTLEVALSREDIGLLCEALDSHEYWQLGREYDLPRNSGFVFLPEDQSTYWQDHEITKDEFEGIARCTAARALLERLEECLHHTANPGSG
jgi:hypothetical protein